jgi:hypothetical protein
LPTANGPCTSESVSDPFQAPFYPIFGDKGLQYSEHPLAAIRHPKRCS